MGVLIQTMMVKTEHTIVQVHSNSWNSDCSSLPAERSTPRIYSPDMSQVTYLLPLIIYYYYYCSYYNTFTTGLLFPLSLPLPLPLTLSLTLTLTLILLLSLAIPLCVFLSCHPWWETPLSLFIEPGPLQFILN